MDQAMLRELSDLNYIDANRELARRAGGTVLDDNGITCWAGAHDLPVLANAAVRTDPRVAPHDVVACARQFFGARGRGFSVIVLGEPDRDVAAACHAAGLKLFGDAPGLVLRERLPDVPPPAGITVRRVETDEDARTFAHVSAEAWATYGMAPDVPPALVGTAHVLRAPHIASVVVWSDGAPVAAAMTILTHGIGGVYWVGTVPAARGQGLAALVTRVVGNLAFDAGARAAVLQASVMGDPVYRKLGYVEVTRYPNYVQFTPSA